MKQFFIISLFFCIFLFTGFLALNEKTGSFFPALSSDFNFHFYKSTGLCFSQYPLESCLVYPGFYHLIASIFTQSESIFILFNIFLVGFLIPFAIYLKTKSLWSLLIYYSSSFAFNVMFSGIFAQAMLTFFVVLLLINDIFALDILFFAMGYFSHQKAIYVLFPVLLFKYIPILLFRYIKLKFPKAKFFFIPTFSLKIALEGLTKFVFFLVPVHLYYMFKLSFSKQILLMYFLIFASILNPRIYLFIPVLLSLWLPKMLNKKNGNIKTLLIFNYLLYATMEFMIFYYRLINGKEYILF